MLQNHPKTTGKLPSASTHSLRLLPQPVDLQFSAGRFSIQMPSLGIHAAELMASELPHLTEVLTSTRDTSKENAQLLLLEDKRLATEAYRLIISPDKIRMLASTKAGMYYAIQTLKQIIRQSSDGILPCLTIKDAPTFKVRAAYLDITRGRVPKLDTLKAEIKLLSEYKINHVQLYIEHVFQFPSHPAIGKSASPLSSTDVRELDAFCAQHHIELVPSIASFGHMSNVLSLPEYNHLAEDLGKGIYQEPDYSLDKRYRGWTLSPAVKEGYTFIVYM